MRLYNNYPIFNYLQHNFRFQLHFVATNYFIINIFCAITDRLHPLWTSITAPPESSLMITIYDTYETKVPPIRRPGSPFMSFLKRRSAFIRRSRKTNAQKNITRRFDSS